MRGTLFWYVKRGGAPAERARAVRSAAEDRPEGEAERAPQVGKKRKRLPLAGSRRYKNACLQYETECQQELSNIVGGEIDKAHPAGALAAGVEVERKHEEIGNEE